MNVIANRFNNPNGKIPFDWLNQFFSVLYEFIIEVNFEFGEQSKPMNLTDKNKTKMLVQEAPTHNTQMIVTLQQAYLTCLFGFVSTIYYTAVVKQNGFQSFVMYCLSNLLIY